MTGGKPHFLIDSQKAQCIKIKAAAKCDSLCLNFIEIVF